MEAESEQNKQRMIAIVNTISDQISQVFIFHHHLLFIIYDFLFIKIGICDIF